MVDESKYTDLTSNTRFEGVSVFSQLRAAQRFYRRNNNKVLALLSLAWQGTKQGLYYHKVLTSFDHDQYQFQSSSLPVFQH